MTPFPKRTRTGTKMTNNPPKEFDPDAIRDAVVELTSPDGTVYRFRYGAVLPYEGQEYVVLVELENDENGEEQLLITRLCDTEDGELSFEVVTQDDVIQAILAKYTQQGMDGMGEGCCCGHGHGECGCGEEHGECGCGECGCSH